MLGVFVIIFILDVIKCYNIDVDHPIIIENPDLDQKNSYFGHSIVLFNDKDHGEKWVNIGAPKATYKNGTKSIYKSGLIYNCPFMARCSVEQKLNYIGNKLAGSFTGSAMDISYQYKTLGISANIRHVNSTEIWPYVRGSIFVENLNNKSLKRYNPLRGIDDYKQAVYHRVSMTGFSMHFPRNQNEIFVGAPGFYNFLGTVFRIKNINETQDKWQVNVLAPQGNFFEYSGYSVTSGYFYGKLKLYYVTALPKGYPIKQDTLVVPYGMVKIFTFSNDPALTNFPNEVVPSVKEEFFGTTFGEYFGSSLAAGDLNGDGLDDLIVGAPYRSNDKIGFNHGSFYVYYGHKKKLQFKKRIDGRSSGGRLGTALMVLGDLDKDGYNELAVSAPNEDASGVIYLYSFDSPTKSLKIYQKIVGKDIDIKLKGFGTSFSRATDIDDNSFLDFAVGSPISGHAVILRSKPTISIHSRIKVLQFLSKASDKFSFKCCYYFKGYSGKNLTILRSLIVDDNFNRFCFENNGNCRNSDEKFIINIEKNMEKIEDCESINLNRNIWDHSNEAISITLSYKIIENDETNRKNPIIIDNKNEINMDTFCKSCPQWREKFTKIERKVHWDTECDHGALKEPCIAKLEIKAKFLGLLNKNTFIFGSKDVLTVEVNVTNNGDAAFSPFLEIVLPNGVNLRSGHKECQSERKYGRNIICEREILLGRKTEGNYNNMVTYLFKLEINVEDTSDLKFFFNASTITKTNEQSVYYLTLKFRSDADLLIEGYSNEPSYIYEQGQPTTIQNIFKLKKIGISPTPSVDVTILIPTKLKNFEGEYTHIFKILNQTNVQNPLIKCQENGDNFIAQNIDTTIKELLSTNSSKLLTLSCEMANVSCTRIKCSAGPFEGTQNYAKLSINMEINSENLDRILGEEWLLDTDQINIISSATVFLSNFTYDNGNKSISTQLVNIVSVSKNFTVSLWILVSSAVVGLGILICISIGLGKAGFFERKQHKILKQLKEEELEEEKIIEEMIKKELEGEPLYKNEQEPDFRYAKPVDLENYWSKMEQNALYNDPLLLMANREFEGNTE